MFFIAHVVNLLATAVLVNVKVPEPYMDEIFHIPQAQQYCRGDYYTWDPLLTTPPGLYFLSNIFVFIGKQFNVDLCTVNALRFTNILFSIGLYFVLVSLTTLLWPQQTRWKSKLYALTLAWLPVNFFCNFVYYTDPGSTFFVMLSYLLVKKKTYHLAGLTSLISITFRQTNVIWACLFMMIVIIDTLSTIKKKNDDAAVLYNPQLSEIQSISQVVKVFSSLIVNTLTNIPILLPKIITFIFCIIAFAYFLVWNNGIVLGDRSHHIAGLYFPQLFYYTSFLSFFAAPFTLSVKSVLNLITQLTVQKIVYGVLSTVLVLFLVHKYTYEHPFLLSDNRHYSFYVWKKVYRRHWSVRYLMAPAYVISGALNLGVFAQYNSTLLTIGYIIGLLLTLVPSPLLEFRYFIIPFLFYMINLPPPSKTIRSWIALCAYFAIHIITVYLYIYKPFVWQDVPNKLQRFIW